MEPPQTKNVVCTIQPEKQLLIVTLNRPTTLNSVDPDTHEELHQVWDFYERNDELRVAILTGDGRSFCSGMDLKESAAGKGLGSFPATGFGGLTERTTLFKPVIAAVNGIAFGGGFELALACDIILATENATFSFPEPKVGIAALAGGITRLPRLIGYQKAMGILLTGRRVTAEEGFSLGFVNQVVTSQRLLEKAVETSEQIRQCSPDSIRATKQAAILSLEEASVVKAIKKQYQYSEVEKMTNGANAVEGVLAFVEKRNPQWETKWKARL